MVFSAEDDDLSDVGIDDYTDIRPESNSSDSKVVDRVPDNLNDRLSGNLSDSSLDDFVEVGFTNIPSVESTNTAKSAVAANSVIRRKKKVARKPQTTKPSQTRKREEGISCSICLLKISANRIASPCVCNHSFCVKCLMTWSKNSSTCPLDRKKFSLINIRERKSGAVIQRVRLVQNAKNATSFLHSIDCDAICALCGESDRPDRQISCDRCKNSFHISCLPLPRSVSYLSWLCDVCVRQGRRAPTANYSDTLNRLIAIQREYRNIPRIRHHIPDETAYLSEGSSSMTEDIITDVPLQPLPTGSTPSLTTSTTLKSPTGLQPLGLLDSIMQNQSVLLSEIKGVRLKEKKQPHGQLPEMKGAGSSRVV